MSPAFPSKVVLSPLLLNPDSGWKDSSQGIKLKGVFLREHHVWDLSRIWRFI